MTTTQNHTSQGAGAQPRLAFLVVLLAVFVALPGCSDANGSSDGADETPERNAVNTAATSGPLKRSVRVETRILEPDTFQDVIELTGEVEALNDAMLSAQTAGTVISLVPLGRALGRGQVVAQLDAGLARAAVDQAEAQVAAMQAQMDLAQDTYDRQQPLFSDSIISALEFERVKTQLVQAKAQVRQAEAGLAQVNQQLSHTRVVMPFNGIVETHLVDQGEQVAPGTPVARVVSTRQVRVRAGVPERYAGHIEVGTAAEVDLRAYGMDSRTGRVSFVGSTIDPSSRSFPIEIALDNSDGHLKPQMVTALFVTRASLQNAIIVPQTAIVRDEDGAAAFVVARTADGVPTVERRLLTLGPSYNGRVVIQQGLEAGDELIVVGQANVAEGDVIEIDR